MADADHLAAGIEDVFPVSLALHPAVDDGLGRAWRGVDVLAGAEPGEADMADPLRHGHALGAFMRIAVVHGHVAGVHLGRVRQLRVHRQRVQPALRALLVDQRNDALHRMFGRGAPHVLRNARRPPAARQQQHRRRQGEGGET